MQTYGEEFLALALIHFFAVVAPGPDFAVTVRQSVRFGRAVGITTALGIGAGISLHVGYTLLGVGALLHTYSWLLTLTSLIGAMYLTYLGVSLVRSRPLASNFESLNAKGTAEGIEDVPSMFKAFLLGFLTNATNPKATLFFLAVFTTLVRPTTPLPILGLYGLWMCGVNAFWFILVATLFTVDSIRHAFMRMGYWLERFMGVILLLFALRLFWQVWTPSNF